MAIPDVVNKGLGVTYDTPNAGIGGIWIDCTVSERHRMSAEATMHPVEAGSEIADHVVDKPDELQLECIVSNTPIRLPQSHADGAREVQRKIELPPQPVKLPLGLGTAAVRVGPLGQLAIKEAREATVTTFEPGFDRIESVFNELRQMKAEGRLVTIHTSLGDYPDMLLTDVDVPRTARTVKSLRFTVGARQIRTVESKISDAPVPKMERAKPKVSGGSKAAKDASDQAAGASESVLHAAGAAMGLF